MSLRKPSLRKIVDSLSDTEDMFKGFVSEEYVVDAVNRSLRSLRSDRRKFDILWHCAEQFDSKGYHRIAAQIMTIATIHLARIAGAYGSVWRDSVDFTSDAWLAAGNIDERQTVLLRLSGIAMKVGRQRSLFGGKSVDVQYRPMWILAKEFVKNREHEQAGATYDALFLEAMQHEDYYAASEAALFAAYSYAHASLWPESIDRGKTAIDAASKKLTYSDIMFDAHLVVGIGYYNLNSAPQIREALDYIEAAKKLFRKLRKKTKEDRDWLYRWVGAANAMHGARQLRDFQINHNRIHLKKADHGYCRAIAHYVRLAKLPVKELGACYASLSIVCRENGDAARADEFATKAMTYEFEVGG